MNTNIWLVICAIIVAAGCTLGSKDVTTSRDNQDQTIASSAVDEVLNIALMQGGKVLHI